MTAPCTITDILAAPEMRAEIIRRIDAAGGVSAWSRKTGISHTVVSLVKNGRREIPETVANACGFMAETIYKKIGTGS